MKIYGLIGKSLAHSFSQTQFLQKFKAQELRDHVYINFEIRSATELPLLLAQIPEIKGLNVTVPFKQKVLPFLDELDETAKAVGAVNTIVVGKKRKRLIGYNTDVEGFLAGLPALTSPSKALILGTGGASKAVSYALSTKDIDCQTVSRTGKGDLSYEELPNCIQDYNLIVNTTPVGTYPDINDAPEIPYDQLTTDHVLYDLVYNPAVTRFMTLGKERGATVVSGSTMLKTQAEAAWKIWQEA